MTRFLIAIDLDGTTLNKESQLSLLTLEVLQYLDRLGHLIMIVTGRPYRTSIEIYQQLNLHSPMINFNGAYCHFPGKREWLPQYHKELDREIVFDLFKRQDELGIQLVCAEGKEKLYTSSMKLPESPYYPSTDANYIKLSRQTLIHNPIAVTLFTASGDQIRIQKKIMELYGDQVSVRTWGGAVPVLEVVHQGIHKAVGVKQVADFYYIPRQNILAFGDEDNDLEMIEYAGHGVAMANAIPALKALSQAITPFDHDQDGLARYLIDYFDLPFN